MKSWILAAVAILAAPFAQAQAQEHAKAGDESAAGLEGLWVSEQTFGPELQGEIVVTRAGKVWTARLGGAEAKGGALDLVFPDGQGEFRGTLATREGWIDGWWIQPPGLPGQAYATPVRLERTGANTWRGSAAPLAQTFTLYLSMLRNEDGRWVGAFRNPEFNMNGGASHLLATRAGDAVSFASQDGRATREGVVLHDPERLRVTWPPLGEPVDLVRAGPDVAARFLPRATDMRAYRRPAQTRDGWRTARARDLGFDEDALAADIQAIAQSDPTARRPQLIHSLLVARRGKLVVEEYFHGHDRDTPHDIRSAGKTFASVMLGAAMHDGARMGPETGVYGLLAAKGPFAHSDPRKADITLAHLMTHTSGLDCDDNNDASAGSEGAMQGQSGQPDWHRYILDLPAAHDPGARYAYCTGGMNLIGAALAAVTRERIPDLFDRLIARPLQFGRYHWNLTPDGQGYLGGGAYIRPRDLAKVGQLYLDGGVWNGRRIVSRDWVRQSTAPQVEINEATTGMDAETFANVATRGADGFAWHLYPVRIGDRTIDSYEANGNGGQLLFVVPDYELVVVITGGNYGQGGIWTRWRDEIVGGQIISAILDRADVTDK